MIQDKSGAPMAHLLVRCQNDHTDSLCKAAARDTGPQASADRGRVRRRERPRRIFYFQAERVKGQGPGLVNVLCVDANGRIVLMLFTIVQQTQGERGTERKKRLL